MKANFFNPLVASAMTVGLLTIAPSALSQTANVQVQDAGVEHLTCVKDSQGLMCKPMDRDRQPVVNVKNSSVVTSEQLGHISNGLLAILYFLLPASLGLAIFLRDQKSDRINKQVMRLEKLWSQTSP